MIITVNKKLRNLEAGTVFDFNALDKKLPVAIVGGNGCGKSTLMQALRSKLKSICFADEKFNRISMYANKFKDMAEHIDVEHEYEKAYFFDSVAENGLDFNNSYDAPALMRLGGFDRGRQSHGEGNMQPLLLTVFNKDFLDLLSKHKSLVVLDEPEVGLSLFQYAIFRKVVDQLKRTGADVFIITHHPFTIGTSVAYHFPTRKEVNSSDYIKSCTDGVFDIVYDPIADLKTLGGTAYQRIKSGEKNLQIG